MFAPEPFLVTATQLSTGPVVMIPLPPHRLLMFHGFNTATGSSQLAYLRYFFFGRDPATDQPDQFFALPPNGQIVLPLGIVLPGGFGSISRTLVGATLPNSAVHVALVLHPFV